MRALFPLSLFALALSFLLQSLLLEDAGATVEEANPVIVVLIVAIIDYWFRCSFLA